MFFQVTERTRFSDRWMDGQTSWAKTICLLTQKGGGGGDIINFYSYTSEKSAYALPGQKPGFRFSHDDCQCI